MNKILAIDDKMDNLITLSALLKNLMPGCSVITAQSGLEGIEKARAELPDVILLDVKMPGMDGLETCQRLMDDESTKHIPVIMITAIKTDSESRVEGLDFGANAFLAKPIDDYELVSQIKVALRIKKAEDALREERNYLERIVEERTEALREEITVRKQAEETLRKSEELFKSYLENAPDGIYINDMEGNFLYGNRKCEEIIGYRRDELIGKNFLELNLLPEKSMNKAAQLLQASIEGKSTGPDEIELISKGGSLIPVEINTNPAQGMGQRIVLSFVRDITDRKQAEAELIKRNVFIETVLENAPIGFAVNTIDDGQRVFLSRNFEKIYGVPPDSIHSVTDYFEKVYLDPVLREKIRERLIADMATGEAARMRWENIPITTQTGDHKVVTAINIPLFEQNLMISTVQDVTERKRAEEKLQDTLESLRKAVGTTIQVMISAIESRDPYTSGHQVRSADIARAIAAEMGLPQEKIDGIRMAGSIHDIGKLSIPAEILSKPTKLSDIEFRLIKEHSRRGYEILKDVESPWPLAEIVYQHHERMDGSGYPRNLKGGEILMEARILSVADVVEAMASHRPYRAGLGIDAALNEIEKNRGYLLRRSCRGCLSEIVSGKRIYA